MNKKTLQNEEDGTSYHPTQITKISNISQLPRSSIDDKPDGQNFSPVSISSLCIDQEDLQENQMPSLDDLITDQRQKITIKLLFYVPNGSLELQDYKDIWKC